MRKFIAPTAAWIMSCAFTTGALAQVAHTDLLVVDVEDFADGEVREAEIIDANYDERTLTVRFESDKETAELVVPENAEIMLSSPPNDIQREVDLIQLNPGDEIELQALEVEGVLHLHIVGIAS